MYESVHFYAIIVGTVKKINKLIQWKSISTEGLFLLKVFEIEFSLLCLQIFSENMYIYWKVIILPYNPIDNSSATITTTLLVWT